MKRLRYILLFQILTLSFVLPVHSGLHASFVSNDFRFSRSELPQIKEQHSINLTGWRGEKLSAQLLLWSTENIHNIKITSNIGGNGSKTQLPGVQTRFVRYVLTDEFGNKCGYHDPNKYPPNLSADLLDDSDSSDLEAHTVLPVWIMVDIPANATSGVYHAEIILQAQGTKMQKLSIDIKVPDRNLPPPSKWSYFLDLWQHPAAVARVESVGMWSDAHFDALVSYMKPLALAGQKVITATINKDPWNNQCYDPYADMIIWTHNADGSWSYDYSVFDRWVQLMMDIGIDRVINCYSLLPWNNEIHYHDAVSGKIINVKADPSTALFIELWTPFLNDFTEHLRKKGWLERTNIAMDERSPEEMNEALKLLHKAAPELGIAMADNKGSYANYSDANIMCVKVWDRVSQDYINKRREKGLITTYYVCCSDSFPNMFTFSSPAEGVYAGWYAAACDYDGFLRWAYNSWVEKPLTDSRFRTWPAGDSYIVYPGFRSSIRFERLIEGIQDFEKIKIVRRELAEAETPEAQEKLEHFNAVLAGFATITPDSQWIERLEEARKLLNELSLPSGTAAGKEKWGAKWIGAISRKDAKLPEGNIYHRWGLAPELAALWKNIDTLATKSILLRKDFSLSEIPKQAIVYVCGLGHYKLYINGLQFDKSVFKPLWSDYNKTRYYNAFDIAPLLRKGINTIGVMLGNGMYNVSGGRYYKFQGSFGPPTLLLCAELKYDDDSCVKVVSDSSWRWSLSPIIFNCIFGGEDYDARLEQSGWNMPCFDDGKWRSVVVQEAPKGELMPQNANPMIVAETFRVAEYKKMDSCSYLFNFGQNHSGFPTIKVKGRRGQKIRLYPGEILENNGQHIKQSDSGAPYWFEYILKSDSVETWTPSFSYYGYQYIEVKDIDYLEGSSAVKPVLLDIESNFVHSSAKTTGTFECSNELFNRIHFIIDRAVRSNMQAVFTDCPHREKLGWLEEIHLNGPGLLFNYDLRHFLPKVMRDIADAQLDNGLIPDIAPEYTVFKDGFRDSPEWGSAGVIIPWMYYEWYGDDSLIKEYYPVMKRYTDYLGTQANGFILTHGLGDWYDYGQKPAGVSQNTPAGITATGHYYMCADYTARAAALLGKKEEQNQYSGLAENIAAAFNKTFFDSASCRYGNGSQCSYAMPLFLDIVPKEYKKAVLDNLVAAIKANDWKLTTGDVGNRYLYQTLAMNGLDEVMYRMHNRMDVPGYGFQLSLGTTTLTEQWDPRKGHSWNHFMMGQIEEWFWKSLAGIRPDIANPGFLHFFIEPQPVGDLKWVKASYESTHGTIVSDWGIENGKFTISVQVPVNTTASLKLPYGKHKIIPLKSGKHVFSVGIDR
jgi:hypothetical protein